MVFLETKLPGVFEIHIDPTPDERGFFARTWCQREFESRGLSGRPVQCSLSFSKRKGTLRGMHYQVTPHEETKLIRCAKGAIYDVALDLRPESPTFKNWVAVELTEEKRNMMYIPRGCAHGFLTLEDETEVTYQMSEFQSVEAARGVRWDDPAFQIKWPTKVEVISERDRTYPDFKIN
jgi:dTDP-4-dehydrorhamnose 3,5-epimerase